MQSGWQPPPGGGGYGQAPGSPVYGGPPVGGPAAGSGYGSAQGGSGYGPSPQGYGPAPGGAMPPPGSAGGAFGNTGVQYEFSEAENATINRLAGRVNLWAIISIVVGVFQLLGTGSVLFGNFAAIGYLPLAIVSVVVGATFLGSAKSLKAVVQTRGNDITNMMAAFDKMSSAFMIQIIVVVLGVLLGILIMVIGIAVGVASTVGRMHLAPVLLTSRAIRS